jgi:hypothetical protein
MHFKSSIEDLMRSMSSESAFLTREQVQQKLEKITDTRLENMGFLCMGDMCDFPDFKDEDPNVSLWMNRCGTRVTMYDDEDGTLSLIEVLNHVQEEKKPKKEGKKNVKAS